MIIKSLVVRNYRRLSHYLKAQGNNEKTRIVSLSDFDAEDIDRALQNMWAIAVGTQTAKPIHHISINPVKGEHLTDKQVFRAIEHCEAQYGYKPRDHQHIIIEHVKEGRQHFHVVWNRVSLKTGISVPLRGHWIKSVRAARLIENEFGLKRASHYGLPPQATTTRQSLPKHTRRYDLLMNIASQAPPPPLGASPPKFKDDNENTAASENTLSKRPEWEAAELLSWAWKEKRMDILAQFGIQLPDEYLDP